MAPDMVATAPEKSSKPEKMAPPSAPMMLEPSPLDPSDDIPDPAVPQATVEAVTPKTVPPAPDFQAHEALLQGFCQHLQKLLERNVLDHHKQVIEALNSVCDTVKRWSEGTLQVNEHAAYQLSDALLKIQERGLGVLHDPFEAVIQARTPSGFVVAFTTRSTQHADLVQKTETLMGWIVEKGCQPL